MIIVCENCESKFNIPDGAIGKDGRVVKCSKCSHQWRQMPIKDDASHLQIEGGTQEEISSSDQPQSSELAANKHSSPAKRFTIPKLPFYQKKAVLIASASLTFFSAILLFSSLLIFSHTSIISKFPRAQALYEYFGIYDISGLKLGLVECSLKDAAAANADDNIIEIEVKVSIVNASIVNKKLSTIRFSIYDINRKFIGSLEMDVNRQIAAGDSTMVEGRLNRVPKESFYVGIDFGNKIGLKFIEPDVMHKL